MSAEPSDSRTWLKLPTQPYYDALYLDLETLRQSVPAGNRELAYENDRIAERYLATLNPELTQDKVREIQRWTGNTPTEFRDSVAA